jgi:class 3 adenylate cyclase/tetratricopeptide (TPR) repeat protein
MAGDLVQFAEFELDRAAYQLRHEGRVVHLQRIPLDLLLFLIERRGQLVTREEIRERIWGMDVFVDTESSINTAVRKLRRVLGDRGRSPRFIETVPAKGYRFIAATHEAAYQAFLNRHLEITATDHETNVISARAGQTGERRHLTVLICDLMNSIGQAVEPDPEEWWQTVAYYHRAAADVIERYGGRVGPHRGCGMAAYFGWPAAHDNDAERGVRAGLMIIEAISRLNQQPSRPKLSGRVGIDSGMVVVGVGADKDADVFGDALNIAVQVHLAAAPDTVLITAETYRLISGLFVIEDRGAQERRGLERPRQFYRVIRPSGVRGRLEAVERVRGLTPFLGREDELRLLVNRWERVRKGKGQVVLIMGEAGIGKSRLVRRFHELIGETSHTWVETRGNPFFQNTPFHPIAEAVHQLVWGRNPQEDCRWELPPNLMSGTHGSRSEQRSGETFARFEECLVGAGLDPAEAVPLLAPVLSLQPPAQYAPSPLSLELQRRRLLAVLIEWVLGTARMQPLVIATDDLHWADPSTLELIQLLVEQSINSQLLLLYTARPEFRSEWPSRAHHTQITLDRLSPGQTCAMVARLAGPETLADDIVAAVVARTDGVPLFVEELTLTVLENGKTKLSAHEIPVTLHDSLMARLDRLGPARETLQVAAILGNVFNYELLRAIYPLEEDELQRHLRTLTDTELLYVRGLPPDASYQFKHALIRDAAYLALLKSQRKEWHWLVAQTIDEKFPALRESHPELLAQHWTEAAEAEKAVAEWSRAADIARARNAFREAQESYRHALHLLDLMPNSSELNLCELQLQLGLATTLAVMKGWSAPETADAYKRVAALAEKSGNLGQVAFSMVLQGYTTHVSGEYSAASALADQALELAIRDGDRTLLAHVHVLQLMSHYNRGDLAGAEKYFNEGLALFEDPGVRSYPAGSVAPLAYASVVAWMLGRIDVARTRMAKMTSAVDPKNLHDLAFSGFSQASLHIFLREFDQAEAVAARALEISEKNQFPYETALCGCALGLARARLGHASEGVALIRRGISGMEAIGSKVGLSGFTWSLAQAQKADGAIMDALSTVDRALHMNPDENAFRPGALTFRGELRFELGQPELAEQGFLAAIALAKGMGARVFELRATMSLARLLASRGRRDEAQTMLADIYNGFSEGFDTADLTEAKAMLQELSAIKHGPRR